MAQAGHTGWGLIAPQPESSLGLVGGLASAPPRHMISVRYGSVSNGFVGRLGFQW